MLTPYEFTAPSAWASYFINGDATSLEDDEIAQADAFLEWVNMEWPVSCDDAGFMHRHDAYEFCPFASDCQTYTFLKQE